MSWLAGIIPALLQWFCSGTVNKSVEHSPSTLADLGLDKKSLTGVMP